MSFDIEGVSEETLNAVKKSTSGFLAATGVVGVDLSGLVSLVPIVTPFRNMLPRVAPAMGDTNARWRAFLNVNSSQSNAAVAADAGGQFALLSEQDMFAPYSVLRLTGRVTIDAIDRARGYADAQAIETLQVLNQVMRSEDINLIGAQAYALPTIGTPTGSSATTGGTIAASTAVQVKAAARSGSNYFYGGSGAASSQLTVTTGTATSTNTVTATLPAAIKGAVAYDWYVGTGGSLFYYTTTVNTSVLITSVPTAAQAVPTTLPDLCATAPSTPPTGDTSFSANWMNGAIASILGDYSSTGLVTPGSGTANGSYWADQGNGTLTLSGGSIAELDTMNLNLWNNAKISPTAYMLNAQQGNDIAQKILGSNSATTFVQLNDLGARLDGVSGGRIGTYVNRAVPDQASIRLEVHPHVPPGTIIARTDRVPYPGANMNSVFEVRYLRDYSQFNYGANVTAGVVGGGPRYDFSVDVQETLVNRAPVANGILANIKAG